MREERVGTLAILASAAGFGFLSPLLKLALEAGARPLPLAAWRFSVAALIVGALAAASGRRLPPRRTWIPLVGLGALYAADALSFTFALEWIPASTATLVFYTYPILVIVLATIFLGEPLTRPRLFAMMLALFGCALTAGGELNGGNAPGVALVLLAVAALSLYLVLGRHVLPALPARGSATIIISSSAFFLWTGSLATHDWTLGGGTRAAAIMLLVALVSTALPITLLAVGLRHVQAGRASILSTIEPILTVLVAWILLGERIAPAQYAGGALIILAVLWLRLERETVLETRPEKA